MEQSCKQQSSLGSKVPLGAVVSDPSASGIPDGELSFPSPLAFQRNVCGLLWLNIVCYRMSLILVIPLLNQLQSIDSPGIRANCSIQLPGFVFI